MLLEFRVSNYRSIGEEQVISLIPAPKQKDHLPNVLTKGKHQALNTIAFYGPNGGGKSNLLKAMSLQTSRQELVLGYGLRSLPGRVLPNDRWEIVHFAERVQRSDWY